MHLLGDRSIHHRSVVLETISLDHVRIDVHFNLGPRERTPQETGIARPLTFRVWARGDVRELIDTIDFEIGYLEGKPSTGAFGQQQGAIHANLGALAPSITYAEIRAQAMELIRERTADRPLQIRTDKEYLNLTLPGKSQFTPIVLSATPEKAVVARVAYVDGKRDVQVLEGAGDRWDFVGRQGRALTL